MIGGGVAKSLSNSGVRAVVFDVVPEAVAQLAEIADPASSPAQLAAKSDVIHLAVVNFAQAQEAFGGPDGILAGAAPGTIVVVLSTLSLPEFHRLAALGQAHDLIVLDCGVVRGDLAAQNGLVAVVGGEVADVERARQTIEAWAKELIHCGPAGTGMAVKIARNAVTFGMWRMLEEAARIAEGAGASEKSLFQTLRSSDPSGSALFQWRAIIGSAGDDPQALEAELAHARTILTKDLAAAQTMAEASSIAVPALDAVRASIDDTISSGRQQHLPDMAR